MGQGTASLVSPKSSQPKKGQTERMVGDIFQDVIYIPNIITVQKSISFPIHQLIAYISVLSD